MKKDLVLEKELSKLGLTVDENPSISYGRGNDIFSLCESCSTKNCSLKSDLGMAMGENYPWWSNEFPVLKPSPTGSSFAICKQYTSPQYSLEGLETGVTYLINLFKKYS